VQPQGRSPEWVLPPVPRPCCAIGRVAAAVVDRVVVRRPKKHHEINAMTVLRVDWEGCRSASPRRKVVGSPAAEASSPTVASIGCRVAFDQKRAQDAFLTLGNAALANATALTEYGCASDGRDSGHQKSVGGHLLRRGSAAGPTTREACRQSAAGQSSVFDRDIALVAGTLGRDFGDCYLSGLGCAIAEALPSPL
jgi:hypothetical protein